MLFIAIAELVALAIGAALLLQLRKGSSKRSNRTIPRRRSIISIRDHIHIPAPAPAFHDT